MICDKCGYSDSVMEFMSTAPASWLEFGIIDENIVTVILKCPKCGDVKL